MEKPRKPRKSVVPALLSPHEVRGLVMPLGTETERMTIYALLYIKPDFFGGSAVKNPPASAGDADLILDQEDPWTRRWQPTPVFLPRKSHGQRSLVGYSPWGQSNSQSKVC